MTDVAPAKRILPAAARTALDYIGPALFALAFLVGGHDVLRATWWLVGGSAVAMAVIYGVERRVAAMPAVWGGAALVFGLATLVFHDPRIVKMKTTVIDLALGLAMFGGLMFRRNPLKVLIGDALKLTDAGWRRLTLRYGVFFLAMAGLNEVVWRTQPDAVWVLWRFPGLVILAVAFAFTQVPTMLKEAQASETGAAEGGAAAEVAALTEVQE